MQFRRNYTSEPHFENHCEVQFLELAKFQWTSMDFNEVQWTSMESSGFRWISINFHNPIFVFSASRRRQEASEERKDLVENYRRKSTGGEETGARKQGTFRGPLIKMLTDRRWVTRPFFATACSSALVANFSRHGPAATP